MSSETRDQETSLGTFVPCDECDEYRRVVDYTANPVPVLHIESFDLECGHSMTPDDLPALPDRAHGDVIAELHRELEGKRS